MNERPHSPPPPPLPRSSISTVRTEDSTATIPLSRPLFWHNIGLLLNKTVSQFHSDISILNAQGNEIRRKTISVNYPLIYKGIYYYQTDWSLISLRFETINNHTIEYPLINVFPNQEKIWLTWISNNQFTQDGIILLIDNLEGYCSIYNNTGQFLGNLEVNETLKFNQNIIAI